MLGTPVARPLVGDADLAYDKDRGRVPAGTRLQWLDGVGQPVPVPRNEPAYDYAPGSSHGLSLHAELAEMAAVAVELTMTIGGGRRPGGGQRSSSSRRTPG